MTSINIMGTYSGIDASVVDQLIEAESAKGIKYTNQKAKIERERGAWKDVNTRLDNLSKKLDVLTKGSTFESRTVSSSVNASDALGVTANRDAATGTYRIVVEELATSSQLTGGPVDVKSINEKLERLSGDLVINYGMLKTPDNLEEYSEGKSFTISLSEESHSLKDIENLINEQTKETGIQASIIDRRLVLTDTVQGNRKISVSSDETPGLIETLRLNETEQKEGFSPGQRAEFKINGVKIFSDSNRVNDVVEGLTFDLKNEHKNTQNPHGEVITVSHDSVKATDAVREFVEQYNSTINFITTQLDVGDPSAENNTTGALTGDGTVMRLQSRLRSIMTRNFSGAFKNIEDIWIEVDRYGVATLDEVKLNKALEADPTNVAKFFYSSDKTPAVTDSSTGEATKQEGISELLRNFIDTYISTSTETPGVIKNKNETYDRMLKDINEQIETFNARIDRKRERYIQQFTALDIAMMQAESQMDYLYSQIGLASTNQK